LKVVTNIQYTGKQAKMMNRETTNQKTISLRSFLTRKAVE
jgi:hypothetical protein